MFSDHNEIKVEINNSEIIGKSEYLKIKQHTSKQSMGQRSFKIYLKIFCIK